MQDNTRPQSCENCGCLNRRDFVRAAALATVAAGTAYAGPFELDDFEKLVPAEKKLQPDWVRSLFQRGTPQWAAGEDLQRIGMPVGGLCCGTVYLSGDGRLWHWDVFNEKHLGVSPKNAKYHGQELNAMGGSAYVEPLRADRNRRVDQGFRLTLKTATGESTRTLDAQGFKDVRFLGQYPIGTVEYADPGCPIRVRLEAFSPFIPLATDDSSLPATIFAFTLENTGKTAVEATLGGWLENAVGPDLQGFAGKRINKVQKTAAATLLAMSPAFEQAAGRPDILFEDWSKDGYQGWTVEGTAFGRGPIAKKDVPQYQGDLGGDTARVANSHATAPGNDVGEKDNALGKLVSRSFKIERKFISLWVGGGNHKDQTCVNLVADGRTVHSVTGKADNRMQVVNLPVEKLEGREAHLEIVDARQGAWGNIGVGRITFSDAPQSGRPEEQPGYGSTCLALVGGGEAVSSGEAEKPLSEKLVGSLGRPIQLAAGEKATVNFVVAWHFANVGIVGQSKRHYSAKFADAAAVARYVAEKFDRLASATRLWRDTWYDASLPYWFLDRTMANTANLATTTCHRFADGRFWAWEGIGCCPGTCVHVWHYAHAMARLFPELERVLRERVDYGLAQHPDGSIGFRGEFGMGPAIDAQAGTILRTYREHQMSADAAFLKRVWPGVKKAIAWLFAQDGNDDGLIEGRQHNTLDTDWYGPVAWLSGLYLAAVAAVEAMAGELGEAELAARCRAILNKGAKNIVAELFEGDYFINKPDPKRPDTINSGTGCHIDQVFGQGWAFQLGLGRVLPEKETRSALRSLWRFNFTPDVGPFRQANPPGRWYAVPGEGGLLMCTFPRGDWNYRKAAGKGPDWAAGYFNECMSGFEHQVASHGIWEGMVMEGLAIVRAIHDRYHPSRRNPYNEVECSDHYARAMASYGVFLAACGFEYHGPKGHLGFAPRMLAEGQRNFKAAFTAAEGWGTFAQVQAEGGLTASIELRYGRLALRTLALTPQGKMAKVVAKLNGKPIAARLTDGKPLISFDELVLKAGDRLEIETAK